jgi:hypothetical protein
MKREFPFDTALKALEVTWSSLPPATADTKVLSPFFVFCFFQSCGSGFGSGSNSDPGFYDQKLKKKMQQKFFLYDKKFQFTYFKREHPALEK